MEEREEVARRVGTAWALVCACRASPLLVAALMAAACGCQGARPILQAGGGIFVPGDEDVGLGWRAELVPYIDIGVGAIPVRISGGSAPIKHENRGLNRIGASVLFDVKEYGWEEGPNFFSDIGLVLAVGGGMVWSGDTASGVFILGLDLQFLGVEGDPGEKWVFRLGYDWMPVDMVVAGRRISDAGGFSATLIYTW